MLFFSRNILVLVCIILLLVAGCGGGYPPEEFAKGRVVLEKQRYQKTLFFEDPNLNLISDLRRGNFDNDPDEEILVVGGYRARLLTLDGKLKDSISFEFRALWFVQAVDIDNDGKYEFLGNGFWGIPAAVLLNSQGKVIWKKYKLALTNPVLTAGDIDGDGIKEVMVPYVRGQYGQGLLVLDAKGNIVKDIKKFMSDYVKAADLNGDGKDEIVYWDEKEKSLIVREGIGEILYRIKPQLDNFKFSITDWVEGSPAHILLVGSEKMQILDIEGKVLATLNIPYSLPSFFQPNGTLLKMNQDNTNPYGYVTLLKGRGGWHRTVLYVNSLSGELLYHEILEEDCNSLLAFNDNIKIKSGSFLVGGRNRVWLYTPLE